MASETKVGLLVGLAFIVCFAVILANRGREQQLSAQLPYSLLTPPRADAAPQRTDAPQRTVADQPVPHQPTDTTEFPREAPDHQAEDNQTPPDDVRRDWSRVASGDREEPHRGSRTPMLSPAERMQSQFAGVGERTAHGDVRDGNPHTPRPFATDLRPLTAQQDVGESWGQEVVGTGGDARSTGLGTGGDARSTGLGTGMDARSTGLGTGGDARFTVFERRAEATPRVDSRDSQRSLDLERALDRITPSVADRGTGADSARARSAQAVGTKYTVVSGDNLYRIARKHYGESSRELVRTIFEANRTVLSHEDEVRVGDVLLLPTIGNARGGSNETRSVREGAVDRDEQPQRAAPRRGRKGAQPFRWYQIEKNDRYTTIASAQLGDAKRWKELFELNRDIFPDPDRIRAGVRIRIPVVEIADARGGRR